MGQAQTMCYRDCRAPNQDSSASFLRWKQWNRIDQQYYCCKPKSRLSTAALTSLKLIPQEHQQLVLNLKINGVQFVDQFFPSFSENRPVVWKKIKQVFPDAVLYQEGKAVEGIHWPDKRTKLFTVFSIISQFKEVMARMLHWPLTEEGIFGVTLYLNGVAQQIIIDDTIPTINGKYLFPVYDSTQLWPILLQKALVKVFGSYQLANALTIQQLFEQITGIPVKVQSQSTQIIKQSSRQLILMKNQQNSSYKRMKNSDLKSSSVSSCTDSSSDQFIHLHREPGYMVSSTQINCSTHSQSFYFRFRLESDCRLSIRVNQLLSRFIDQLAPLGQQYAQVLIDVARLDSTSSNVIKLHEGFSQNQKTYLQGEFVDMIAGDYFIHIRVAQRSHLSQFIAPCSLVIYAPQKITIRPVLSITKAEQMKQSMLRQEYYRLIEQVVPSARGRSLQANTVCTDRRVLLLIVNHQAVNKKIKLILLSSSLELEEKQGQRETIMQVEGRAERLVSLLIRGRVQLDSKTPAYEIRVVG